jgi:putative endonuclease
MWSVYFLQSSRTGKYYVGVTSKEPQERLKEHNSGHNEWTKHNGPFVLRYHESYLCKEDAYYREKFYKSGFGKKIRDCILKPVEKNNGL